MSPTQSIPFLRLITQPGAGAVTSYLVLLNFIFYFARPQNSISPLGSLKLALICAAISSIFWAFRWYEHLTPQKRLLFTFLAFEGCRGILGKLLFDDLVRNDSLQFHTWADLALQFCGLIFPLSTFFLTGTSLHSFVRVWLLVSIYLGVFAVTHAGRGPGGFIGDENDTGLVLLMLLPVALSLLIEPGMRFSRRLLPLCATLAVLAGVFATFSRGTFVGLVGLLGYYFLQSRRKLQLILALLLATAALIPFVPEGYIEEMRTIADTSAGTAADRRHFWTVATRVWLDPKHFVFGVGLLNTPFHLGGYEKPQELVDARSIGGRAVHSIYFQLLPDLGVWGIIIIGSLIFVTFRDNSRSRKLVSQSLTKLSAQLNYPPHELGLISRHLYFINSLLTAMSASLIGILVAGLFISALYYPPLWLITCLSGAVCLHARRFVHAILYPPPSAEAEGERLVASPLETSAERSIE